MEKVLASFTAEHDQMWSTVREYFQQRGAEAMEVAVSHAAVTISVVAHLKAAALGKNQVSDDLLMAATLLRVASALVALQIMEDIKDESH